MKKHKTIMLSISFKFHAAKNIKADKKYNNFLKINIKISNILTDLKNTIIISIHISSYIYIYT